MTTKRYTWNFEENASIWENDCYNTIEECIQEAEKEKVIRGLSNEVVYIGETEDYLVYCNAETILEQLEQDAYNQCGEVAEDWNAFEYGKDSEDLRQLSNVVTDLVTEWLSKKGSMPEFYSIRNVKEYRLNN